MFFFLQLVILLHSMFILTTHPLFMGFMLMLVSISYGLMSYFMLTTPWVAYILIMVFISGAMVMFIYMASLSSNENMKVNLTEMLMLFLTSELMLITLLMKKGNKKNQSLTEMNTQQSNESMIMIYKTYNEMMTDMTIMLITYLLLVLIVTMKIISFNKGPLRT